MCNYAAKHDKQYNQFYLLIIFLKSTIDYL